MSHNPRRVIYRWVTLAGNTTERCIRARASSYALAMRIWISKRGWLEHQITLRPEALNRLTVLNGLNGLNSSSRLVETAIESTRRISQYRARRNLSCGNKGKWEGIQLAQESWLPYL